MFADTIDFGVNGATITLTRVNQDGYSALYRYRDSNLNVDFAIRHTSRLEKGKTIKTDRHNIELVVTETTAATLTLPAHSKTHKAYFVLEMPETDGPAEVYDITGNIQAFLSNANVAKLVGWQS